MRIPIEINQAMPAFKSDAWWQEQIQTIHSHQFHGKWLVLAFYPADFTPICSTEMKEMAAKYTELQAINTELISISTDTAAAHKEWQQHTPALEPLKFPMLADPDAAITTAFGVINPHTNKSWRATFIIDPHGLVKAYEIHDTTIGRSISEIIRKITLFQFVAKRELSATPEVE